MKILPRWIIGTLLFVFTTYLVSGPSYGELEDQLEYHRIESIVHRRSTPTLAALDDPSSAISRLTSSSFVSADLSFPLPVMQFNIRFDGKEHNPSNLFENRLPRIQSLFQRINPWIVGIQEGLTHQVKKLLTTISSHYQPVFYLSREENIEEYFIAIIYDSNKLTLVEQDYWWMSETPKIPYTKSWNSRDPRMLNMARFKLKKSTIEELLSEYRKDGPISQDQLTSFESSLQQLNILAFNTHLDVGSEEARRAQSIFVAQRIQEWNEKVTNALTVLTGDFNTAVGQRSYLHLTDAVYAQQHHYTALKDAWVHSDHQNSQVIHSFHGWQGSRINNVFVQALSVIGLTAYATQMNLPRGVPHRFQEWKEAAHQMFSRAPEFGLRESMPAFPFNRLHVDWVLYQEPKGTNLQIRPVQASLLDVRNHNFSSDHYPLVVVFQIKPW